MTKYQQLCVTFTVMGKSNLIAELRRPEGSPSGASIIIGKGPHVCIENNRNPCNSFFMVNMAGGMDHGRVGATTTTTTMTNDIAQHGGQISNTKSCSLGL